MTNNYIKTENEIAFIAEGGQLLGQILQRTAKLVRPGISTYELNEFAEREILKTGGKPSFVGYGSKKNPFPAGLCTSINDAVVHGIPSEKDILEEGDLVGLDIGMQYKGFFTDTAITVPVGKISTQAQKLMETTRQCLVNAIAVAKPGNTTGDIGYAIQTLAESAGFSVVTDLVGHGVGYAVHEDPAVPCYGEPGSGEKLYEGMVIAIEPMVCEKLPKIYFDSDGWTIRTSDGGLASHFEHTVVITKTGAKVLT